MRARSSRPMALSLRDSEEHVLERRAPLRRDLTAEVVDRPLGEEPSVVHDRDPLAHGLD